jgi:hypothetical protein
MILHVLETESSGIISFTLCGSEKKFFEGIAKDKKVKCSIVQKSKTRYYLAFQHGENRFTINPKHDTFKQHEEDKISWVSGERQLMYYFVKSKKQDYYKMLQYIHFVAFKIFEPVIGDQEFLIELEKNNALADLKL